MLRIDLFQFVEDVLLEEAHFLFVVVVSTSGFRYQLLMTQSETVRTSVAIVDFLEPTSTSLVDVAVKYLLHVVHEDFILYTNRTTIHLV